MEVAIFKLEEIMTKNDQSISNGNNNLQAGRDIIQCESLNQYLSVDNITHKMPRALSIILPKLAISVYEKMSGQKPSGSTDGFKIPAKIKYNELKSCQEWVNKYSDFGRVVENSYESSEDAKPFTKTRILEYLHAIYITLKTELHLEAVKNNPEITMLDVVKENADKIMMTVLGIVKNDLYNAVSDEAFHEDIPMASLVIVAHGFISCKILEEPPKEDSDN